MTTCPETTRLTMSPFHHERPSITCRRDVDHKGEHQGVEHVPPHLGDPNSEFSWEREDRPGYDRLVTWDQGGGSSTALVPEAELSEQCHTCRRIRAGHRVWGPDRDHDPDGHRWADCINCGITYHVSGGRPAYADGHPDVANGWCFHCALWYTRAVQYAQRGTLAVRVHPDSPTMQPDRLYGWATATGAFGGLQVTVTWDDGRTEGPRDSLWDAGRIPDEWSDYFPPNARVERHEKIRRPGHTTGFNGHGQPLTYTAHPEV